MTFPNKKFFGLIPDGWKDWGSVIDVSKKYKLSDCFVPAYGGICKNCKIMLHVIQENHDFFIACPKCLKRGELII